MSNCKVTKCPEPKHAMGFCHLHYVKRMRAVSLEVNPQPPWCGVANCDEPHYDKGFCQKHTQELANLMAGRSR